MYDTQNCDKSLVIYQCGTEKCEPNHDFGPQVRNHFLIHYVASGKGIFKVNGVEYPVNQGQCFVIFPGIVTYYCADKDEPWEYFWVGFSGSDAGMIAKRCGLLVNSPVITIKNQENMLDCLKRLYNGFSEGANSFKVYSAVYEYFSILEESSGNRPLNNEDIISKVTDYINHGYSYDISIDQIAKYVGVCRSQLFRIFKSNIGVSPQEYLVKFRLSSAYNLLTTTNLSVSEIMYSVGYRNMNNFSKMFKKRYGVSPSNIKNSSAEPKSNVSYINNCCI